MKNFLFDVTAIQPTVDGKYHGGGKYGKKVYQHLATRSLQPGVKIFGLYNSAVPIDDDILTIAKKNNITLLDLKGNSLTELANKYQIDRFYSALPYALPDFSSLAKTQCETIGTIHGLRNLEMPIQLKHLQYIDNIKQKAKEFIKIVFTQLQTKRQINQFNTLLSNSISVTVSEHSKYSIKSLFPNIKNDIKVFYAPDVTDLVDTSPTPAFTNRNYFLMVGANRWIKNSHIAINALDNIFTKFPEITNQVIITGVANSSLYSKNLKNKNRFIFHDYVGEALLNELYKNAFAFIYMSLNEGFGYPPLEAMKHGVPVICSPFSAITEVCGDAVLYSNPYSSLEIQNRILQLFDSSKYANLQKASRDRFKLIHQKQVDDLEGLVNFLLQAEPLF